MDATYGITKIELVRYYALVGELMMEHLQGRPVSLVQGAAGGGQTHVLPETCGASYRMEGIGPLDRKLDPDHPPYLEVALAARAALRGADECHGVPHLECGEGLASRSPTA